jgi:hypothetical protein
LAKIAYGGKAPAYGVETYDVNDGRRINVREISKGDYEGKDKWPTLEIQNADGSRSELKIRYTKGKL